MLIIMQKKLNSMSFFSRSNEVIRAESHIAKLLRNVYGGGTGLNLATLDARD